MLLRPLKGWTTTIDQDITRVVNLKNALDDITELRHFQLVNYGKSFLLDHLSHCIKKATFRGHAYDLIRLKHHDVVLEGQLLRLPIADPATAFKRRLAGPLHR